MITITITIMARICVVRMVKIFFMNKTVLFRVCLVLMKVQAVRPKKKKLLKTFFSLYCV